jgi:hypothetical protein
MATIDIPLPSELTELLTPPKCLDLNLPKPGKTELKLPTGGTIKPIPDITKGIPTDCGMNFNLALQMAPIMASMECLLKMLKFISAVKSALEAAKNPPDIPKAISDLLKAIEDVMPCVNMVIVPPLNMIPFVKSLLLMIARMLRCTAQALRSAIEIMDGISLDLKTAQEDGNDDLAQQLECAKENAQLAMEGTMVSLEPVMILLDIAKPFLEIAGVSAGVPQIASDGTLDGMKSALETIETTGQTLEDVANAL